MTDERKPPEGTGRVEKRITIHEPSGVIEVRRNGDEGLWLKPEKLDGDGEFHLTLEYLGEALRLLGFNAAAPPAQGEGRRGVSRCRECGCLDMAACESEVLGPCWWVEPDLCSACAPDAGDDWEHPPREVTDAMVTA